MLEMDGFEATAVIRAVEARGDRYTPDHHDDSARDDRRSRTVFRCRHGRLFDQADFGR